MPCSSDLQVACIQADAKAELEAAQTRLRMWRMKQTRMLGSVNSMVDMATATGSEALHSNMPAPWHQVHTRGDQPCTDAGYQRFGVDCQQHLRDSAKGGQHLHAGEHYDYHTDTTYTHADC